MIIGLVGKPNVGKSAFFRALTLAEAMSGNFPFTTIKANSATGYVKIKDPADEFGKISNPRNGFVENKKRFVPIKIIDVAGLVPGASEGVGLGNQFLDDLREADCLIHVVDITGSTNEKGESCELEKHNPIEDVKFLENELNSWFYNILKNKSQKIIKQIKHSNLKLEESISSIVSGLNIKNYMVESAIKELNLTNENIESNFEKLAIRLREISKPILICLNKCDSFTYEKCQEKLKELQNEFKNLKFILSSAMFEEVLRKAKNNGLINYNLGENNFEIKNENLLNENQKKVLENIKNYLENFDNTGIQNCINFAVFDILKLKPIFPGGVSKLEDSKGNVLPDCFLMEQKATALDFAYKLHTDFGKNFIKAIDVKTKKLISKDTILNFCDIVEIISGK